MRAGVAIVVAAALAACSEPRERAAVSALVTWRDDVEPAVGARCTAGCHAGAEPAAGYDLGSYLGALAGGGDATANAIAGDPSSRLLARLAEGPAGDVHAGFADLVPLLRAWVVASRLAYLRPGVHDPGLLDPASARFHGRELHDRGWDFALCQGCHGDDFAGGASGASCLGCHRDGPTACDTCHAAVPASGAHRAHVESGASAANAASAVNAANAAIACDQCHRVPARWDDPGHILTAAGELDPAPAEVALGALAGRDVAPPRRTSAPAYDPASGRCSNVYCHGGTLGDAAASEPAPAWSGGPLACGSCHGAPPADHSQDECATCHRATVGAGGALGATHIDGAIDAGDGPGSCTGCHGDATGPAPPGGLHGERFTTALAVGAHRAHLEAPGRLRGPIACGECHLVPAAVTAPGHLDSALPAEVFPAGAGALARADAAQPAWDRATASCTGSYCHGGGARLALDTAAGRVAAPRWIAGGQVYCGSCHGVPPTTPPHTPGLGIGDCTSCHPSVDGSGNIVFAGASSQHLDGAVDVR